MSDALKAKLKNLLSRKFLIALGGLLGGVVTIMQGSVPYGSAVVITSILGYLIAEGYIDAKTAKTVLTTAAEVAETISDKTENTVDDVAADALEQASDMLDTENIEDAQTM